MEVRRRVSRPARRKSAPKVSCHCLCKRNERGAVADEGAQPWPGGEGLRRQVVQRRWPAQRLKETVLLEARSLVVLKPVTLWRVSEPNRDAVDLRRMRPEPYRTLSARYLKGEKDDVVIHPLPPFPACRCNTARHLHVRGSLSVSIARGSKPHPEGSRGLDEPDDLVRCDLTGPVQGATPAAMSSACCITSWTAASCLSGG